MAHSRPTAHSLGAGARALSNVDVDSGSVQQVYTKLASVYDWMFCAILQAGRVAAIRQLNIHPGDSVLEVGIGTGINAPLYPRDCAVTGIDASRSMLDLAARRIASYDLKHVKLLEMDAAELHFPDDSFDAIYASYLISVVEDPVGVAREMRRVCRPGGRIVLLNHFRSGNPIVACAERLVSPLVVHAGFRSDLDLSMLLVEAGLEPMSVEKVNTPPIWSLVTCRKAEMWR
jgi:phosphatidylethanolamine/phosphatidyl-N-methylethanolamine N-methyltransferase